MNSKKEFRKEVLIWTLLFLVMVLAPLYLALVGHDRPGRGFLFEFGVGLGFIGIALMGLQFVLTARFKNVAASFGTDALLNFHRQAGYVAYGFILGHVVVLLAASSYVWNFFDPRVNAPRAFALVSVLFLMTLLVALTIWRKRFNIPYEWWRISHAVFAFLILFIGLAHILMVGHYISELWKQVLWIGLAAFAMGMLVHVRIVKPWKMWKQPYKATNVWQETEDVWTLEAKPAGHQGFSFKAGQFAWITLGSTPFSLQQHPFTIASSSEAEGRYEFTIKELGDFSSTVKEVDPGTKLYLEGPYGAFTLNPKAESAFFVVGGIGITPVMSMLRTMHDRKDQRPCKLIYGNPDWKSAVYSEELSELEDYLNLEVIHVLENPPAGWNGQKGLISREMILNELPENCDNTEFYVCGPEPLMDLAETVLRRQGVPLYNVHSERFNIV